MQRSKLPPRWKVAWLFWASCRLRKCRLGMEDTCLHLVLRMDPSAASLPSPPAAAAVLWANWRGRRAGLCAAGGGAILGWEGLPSLGSSAPPTGRCWNLRPGSSDEQPGGAAAASRATRGRLSLCSCSTAGLTKGSSASSHAYKCIFESDDGHCCHRLSAKHK